MLLTGTASALTGRAGSRAPVRAPRPDGLAPAAPAAGVATGATARSASPRRPPPRASAARSRRWWYGPATGRWPPCCSCCRTTAPRRRCRAPSSGMADGRARLVRPLPHRPRQPVLPTGTQTAWILAAVSRDHRARPPAGAPAGLVPGRRRAVRLRHVDRRPGTRRQRLHRLGHRPQHGTAGDPAGRGHGADRHRRPRRGLAFARRRGRCGGAPRSAILGVAALGAALALERQLPAPRRRSRPTAPWRAW